MIAITESEFKRLANYMRDCFGIQLKQEKKTLVNGRLQNILAQEKYKNFSTYLDGVFKDPTGDKARTLVNKLTTNHTFFMREKAHFDYYKKVVLPYLSSTYKEKKDLRIWSAGCSSGEEAYTLAMVHREYFGENKKLWDTKVLGTDISTKALEKAVKGIYDKENILSLPERWQKNYFQKTPEEKVEIKEEIKREAIFRSLNLMNKTFPFQKKFHVIFCRNVMIYFAPETKNQLIDKFYEATEPGGYLFIGHAESINKKQTKYKYIMPAVYRKE